MNNYGNRAVPTVLVIVTAVLIALGLAGCGGSKSKTPSAGSGPGAAASADASGDPSAAPSPADLDPCSLVTKAEADKLAGITLQPPLRVQETCRFTSPPEGSTAQVEIFTGEGAHSALNIDKVDLAHPFHPVAGLGDEAYAEDGAIWFRKGDLWVELALLRLDSVDTGPPLEALARTAAGRV